MSGTPAFMQRLGLADDADERAIRRAYARALKLLDQEAEPQGFQSLREAYEEALMWLQGRAPVAEEDATAASASESPPARAGAADMADLPEADTAGAAENAEVDAVFAEFRQHCQTLDATVAAPWQAAIRQCLDGPQLVSIGAREAFELRVATLLSEGWQPGHEALLVAAITEFQWSADRRRLLRLGYAGAVLDAAINEREVFDQQSDEVCYEQRRVIARLRDGTPPATRQLVADAPRLELLIARFPHWLAMVTSVDHINDWRERVAALPAWRRRMASLGRRRAQDEPAVAARFQPLWTVIVGVFLMLRLVSCGHDAIAPQASGPSAAIDTAADHFKRGVNALDTYDQVAAINHFSQSLQLDPKNADAYALRAMAYVRNDQPERAEADLWQSAQFDSTSSLLFRARGALAMKRERYADAIEAYTRSLQREPDRAYTLMLRARAYFEHGDDALALADADQVLKLNPDYGIGPYRLRMDVATRRHDQQEAGKQADAMLASNADNSYAYLIAARNHMHWGDRQQALAMLARGIAAAPDAELYLYRAGLRGADQKADKRADLNSALALAPLSPQAIGELAALNLDEGDYGAAATLFSKALNEARLNNDLRARLLILRGVANARSGAEAQAQSDYANAGKLATTAAARNHLCWMLATRNAALPIALTLCDAALAETPSDAPTLDSRGMVLLRMGRYRDAIGAYDAAIRQRPFALSLFGRGLAKRKLGDLDGGNADLRAARAKNDTVDQQFREMGITPD